MNKACGNQYTKLQNRLLRSTMSILLSIVLALSGFIIIGGEAVYADDEQYYTVTMINGWVYYYDEELGRYRRSGQHSFRADEEVNVLYNFYDDENDTQ